MPSTLAEQIFESFLQRGERANATHQLGDLGVDAVPILKSLFNGEAKNRWGVSYSKLGIPLDCGLVTIGLLGTLAKLLEPFVRDCLRSEHIYAAEALRAIGTLDEASIIELASCLDKNSNLASEAAYTLCCCGAEGHEAVIEVVNSSPFASWILSSAKKSYLEKEVK
ncbi:hypothetical protein K9N68_32595 [Kovacikia minuta CCNUW1]|uniref:hypothetical protein n=1 Tax=Kovacikia minuta TaxID=2931930 RepID=UPI001CC8F3E0|nr:hypothetical protein [Kovacikia minuta]UBF26199.1 hypothetical protein K9N68_32595 [Kovacikia minuta CCNUW1]